MASSFSVSKGVFIFKNGAKSVRKGHRNESKTTPAVFCDALWYHTYRNLWNTLECKIQDLNNNMFSNVLQSLIHYLNNCYNNIVSEIPAAALLTGINMPDHIKQFEALKSEIKRSVTPHVCTLNGEDCQTIKYLVEIMINQLIVNQNEDESETISIRKYKYSFSLLQSWYEELYISSTKKKTKNIIVVIIPDFENFSPKILEEFLLISSSYKNILPLVFVFGVSTSLAAVHRSIPCHVSSQIKIQVFHSTSSTEFLNNIVENIFFDQECPFHLGSKVFNLFTDIFLFYDLSVNGFVENFKYAMIEHFSYGNAMALCVKKHPKSIISDFSHQDLENVRHLMSFRHFVEKSDPETRIRLLTDDDFFKQALHREIKKLMEYLPNFHLFLKCLHSLVCDLPKAPLGKQLRELYAFAVSKKITECSKYAECFKILSFSSREELIEKVVKVKEIIINNVGESRKDNDVTDIIDELDNSIRKLQNAEIEDEDEENVIELMGRLELKEKLLQMSRQKNSKKNSEKVKNEVLNYISNLFEEFLIDPKSFYFHEIFFFDDITIQNHIVGTHRSAIHTAMNDPFYYLQCSCCNISNDAIILQSMPDISIVYKLHLEYGKMINLYDWLQSYLAIVDPQDLDENTKPKVQPEFQARFTQAVAELEYLGFIKSSKRKTDHVARLTWGG